MTKAKSSGWPVEPDRECDCGHREDDHTITGACTQDDSYGVRCSCPSPTFDIHNEFEAAIREG